MNENLFKESSAVAREIGEELGSVLGELDSAVGQPLVSRLAVETHPTPLLVVTGQFSSGKSTLIEALTNRAFGVGIGSGVTTGTVTEYDWDGDVRLVDTPGVHAGQPHHDELAEIALQSADLVLFAVPVELFDDVLVAHLRDVLGRLGKSRQTLIVITKAGTLDAAADVRQEAIKNALGSFDRIPWVQCDAQYYLDGLDLADSDPAASSAYIEASGLNDVTVVINGFARQQGELGRLSQPLQLIVALALEASASLSDDPDEQAALIVLARQRSALSKKRIHLDSLFDSRTAQFRADAVRAATQFVDRIERDEEQASTAAGEAAMDAHMTTLNLDLRAALDRFKEAVRHVLDAQFDDLASEVLEIEATPYGRVSLVLAHSVGNSFESRDVSVGPGPLATGVAGAALPTPPEWANDLSKYFDQFHTLWGAGRGVKASAGSAGHNMVLNVGHAFGKKFKPWEAVRLADKVGKVANVAGKVAKVGGVVVAIGLEAYGVYRDERAAVKAEQARTERRRTISQEILAQADSIAAEALRAVRASLDETFEPQLQRIDTLAAEIRHASSTRSVLRDRLASVGESAETALAALSVAADARLGSL